MTVDPNAATQGFPAPRQPARRRPHPARYLVPALVAAAVAVALGVYGKVHHPTGTAFNLAGFSSTGAVKSWLASTAFFFALVQLVSAFMVYGRLPGPRWAPALHRWSGRAAFLVAVPVAVHCLYALAISRTKRAFCGTLSCVASSSAPSVQRCCCSAWSASPAGCCPSSADWCSPCSRPSG